MLLVAGLIVYTLFFVSEETRIAKRLEKGRKAFEAERVLTMAGLISADYSDEYGYEKATLLRVMQSFFSDHRDIQVEFVSTEIECTAEDRAHVRLRLRFGGDVANESFHDVSLRNPRGVVFRIDLVKRGRSWKVVRFALP